jgi:Amt family ammonium transporter
LAQDAQASPGGLSRWRPPQAAAAGAGSSGCRSGACRRGASSRRRPVPNKGDVAWMLVATLLVIMMTIPGLALFYGGLVRSKNMLSVLMQVMVTFSLIVVLWFIYGYSLAFTEGNAFIGGFDRLFLKGVFDPAAGTFAMAATFSKGVYIPEIVFVAFQATFAGHHLLPDRRRLRRAHQVLGGAAVHGAVVHLQLRADRAHGLVLDGPGRLCRRRTWSTR